MQFAFNLSHPIDLNNSKLLPRFLASFLGLFSAVPGCHVLMCTELHLHVDPTQLWAICTKATIECVPKFLI